MESVSPSLLKRAIGCRKIILSWLAVAALSILPLYFFVACSSHKNAEQGPAPITVVVEKPRSIQDIQTVPVSGSVVSPDAPSNVSFLVTGRVAQVIPREGEYVKKGQLLASLDPTEYRLAASASAAQVEQAKVAFLRAEDEYQRMRFLYESKSLAENDFQKFRAARDGAQQQLEQAMAGEQISRKRLSDATLHAAIDGFITRRSIEPGEMASPGRPVFEIARLDPVEVSVGVPETDIQLVKIGQKATVTVPALPGQSFNGTVRVINVAADLSTRTYMTRISVLNPKHILKVGMVAEAKIRGDRRINSMVLPGEAVVRDPQGATTVFVYYPEQRRVYARRIETGSVYDTAIEVKKGLAGSEWIVISGQDKLRDGALVSVTAPAAKENGVWQGGIDGQ
jgi:RND family efflux transporter MFP subunit